MTGVEINQVFSQQIGQTYSGIEDIAKKNRRFKKALINAIEEKYRNLNEQREFDEIKSVIKTEQEFTPAQNTIDISANDILHVLAIKAKYKKPIPAIIIKNFTNTTPIVVETFGPTNIRTGDVLDISNVVGNIAANGEYRITQKSLTKFTLEGSAGNGQFAQSTNITINRVFYNYCQFLKSDEKISSFKVGTPDYPQYEIANEKIKLYPYVQGAIEPTKATIDYISRTLVTFELDNNIIDYSTTYTDKFIYHVIDIAAKDFNLTFRDYPASQGTDQQMLINP
jgi:hypothetical protein